MTNGKVYEYLVIAKSWGNAREWAIAHGLGTDQWHFVNVEQGIPEHGHFMAGWVENVAVTDQVKDHPNVGKILNRAKYYQTETNKPQNGFAFLYGEKR